MESWCHKNSRGGLAARPRQDRAGGLPSSEEPLPFLGGMCVQALPLWAALSLYGALQIPFWSMRFPEKTAPFTAGCSEGEEGGLSPRDGVSLAHR